MSTFSAELHTKLQNTKHVALLAHRSPDGDACGSLGGLEHLIRDNYPHLTVSVVVPVEKQIDSHINWVLGETVPTIPLDAELVLLLDTSLLSRTALAEMEYPKQPIISVDHHEFISGSIEGYRDVESPSTTLILTDIARELGWTVSADAATALLLGIYTDTGGFIHRNTNQRAFEAAAFLMSKGANQGRIAIEAFGNNTLDYLHHLGDGLMSIVQEGPIACLFFQETDENIHLRTHIIGYLSGLCNVDIACVLTQRENEVKGSLRTRKEGIDLNALAQKFGGGGHKKASGFELDATIVDNQLTWNGKSYTPQDFIHYLTTLL